MNNELTLNFIVTGRPIEDLTYLYIYYPIIKNTSKFTSKMYVPTASISTDIWNTCNKLFTKGEGFSLMAIELLLDSMEVVTSAYFEILKNDIEMRVSLYFCKDDDAQIYVWDNVLKQLKLKDS